MMYLEEICGRKIQKLDQFFEKIIKLDKILDRLLILFAVRI